YVNTWRRKQPVDVIVPGVHSTCTSRSQLSVAVTRLSQAGSVGLQPSSPPAGTFASTGFVVSSFHVYVTSIEALLPHLSVAVYVNVWLLLQPVPVTRPRVHVTLP